MGNGGRTLSGPLNIPSEAGESVHETDHVHRMQDWISGPKKNGTDKLYGGIVEIDEDARVEYWTSVRGAPGLSHFTNYRS